MKQMNYTIFDRVLNHDKTLDVVPMYEHGIDYPIITEIMGYNDSLDLADDRDYFEFWRRWINFYDQMGYPYVSVELGAKFPSIISLAGKSENDKITRGYVDENNGPIKSIDDVKNDKLWLDIDKVFDYGRYEKILSMVPSHMKAVGGCSGGPFENATFLLGLANFCIGIYEDEELIEGLLERVGTTICGVAERLVKYDKLGVYRFGDDLGYTQGTMISPLALRKYIFPWQKKVVDIVHKSGKKFLLHSCGKLNDVMDDLIDDVGIDAKHSFEDKGTPVTYAKEKWGDKIAIIGGIDVDFLCRSSEKDIKKRTIETLKICSKGGGYAAGSGNTITSYMPPKNYLAMVEAVKEFNGIK